MRTFLPPKGQSSRQGDSGGGPEQTDDYLSLCRRRYPEARRTAMFSLLPGLGQVKNGEFAKGILFFAITGINCSLLLAALFSKNIEAALSNIAAGMQRSANFELTKPLLDIAASPAVILYGLLLLCFVAYAMRDAYDRRVQMLRDGEKPPRYQLTLPEAASGSYLFHFALMASFILMVVFFVGPKPNTAQTVQIELVHEDPPKKAEKPAPPAPKHEKKVETPKPRPKPVVVPPKKVVEPPKQVVHKVEPPKPMPVAVAVPTTQPTPLSVAPVEQAAPAPVVAPTPTPSGSPGGSGNGRGGKGGPGAGGQGDQEVDMGPYMRDLQRRIKRAWHPPKGNESARIKVSFKVHKDGHISHLKLVTSSGVGIADDAATDAVEAAAPFATLPDGVGDDVDINFTFDYNVFGRGR